MANLNELMASIAEAIRHKRNITDKINAQDFPNEIEKITGGGGSKNEPITITTNGVYTAPEGVGYSPINVSVKLEGNPLQYIIDNHDGNRKPSCDSLFSGYKGTSLEILSQCNFSKVTNMKNMFYNCSNLTTIPQLDTSKVTNTDGMFYSCRNLASIPQLDTSKVTNMHAMFYCCSKLITIPLLNTSKVTNMQIMFYECSNLNSIPSLNTSQVQDMSSMFYNCLNLTTIPSLNTSKVTDMGAMFYNCSSLTSIQLDTSNVLDMSYMFYHCYKLTTIDITHMKTKESIYTKNFAAGCCSLTKLIIRNMDKIPQLYVNTPFSDCYHFTGTVNSTYNPEGLKDGRIYVPDDKVEALKATSVWNNYADIIVPLSLLDATEINDINVYEDEEGNIINIDNLSYEEVQ